ncbi:MAG TPA: TonB-dependent receptor [Dinghuibacter sp.]|uniref:TonB-dependent receptor n=1 Tax=Dinghuibacter sp. TaxID=2024697 RepID=UPI002B627D5D|nr:TonB-dependent receptor [Dinghuibacter sp.]HTJ14523.1 TonB-dependent receptor [Dinghuibacter sp.]
MRKQLAIVLVLCVSPLFMLAQGVTVSGTVRSAGSGELVPAVTVTVKGTSAGTFTNDHGYFKLTVPGHYPLTIILSSVGFASREVQVPSADPVSVNLDVAPTLGQEVVVSATRVPVKILESPVSIERLGQRDIVETPSGTFYDALGHLNGVDVVNSSMTFTSLGTRGFNSSGNVRMNQLTDGMDNQAPGLNFSVGNIVGLTELDVDNVELLPGASSALYGSGGMNGTLLITSKDPFKYQGLSVQVKQGVNHVGDANTAAKPYYDWAARYAKAFNNRFAFRLSGEYIAGTDWEASNNSNYSQLLGQSIPGDRNLSSYNGVNVYGDEINFNVNQAMRAAGYGFLIPAGADSIVSRTGYNEKYLVDYNTYNFKLDGVLSYKITNSTVASLTAYYGIANTVYTGSDRYDLKNVKIGQYKAEVKGRHFYVRAYTTQENSGDSYNVTVLAQLINESWSGTRNVWAPTYTQDYIGALAQGVPYAQAQAFARSKADSLRVLPGTPGWNAAFNTLKGQAIPQGGLFVDRTNLYVADGMYDFADVIKFADITVGATYKRYVLNSHGTLFADTAGTIPINEEGVYAQIQKGFIDDILHITVAGRYDKNENFQGRFTPRVTALIKVAKDNNIRLSYQTAYRFPSTQNQYIDLNTGQARLIGGLPQFANAYNLNGGTTFDTASLNHYAATGVPPTPFQYKTFKPESVSSYEIGYKGVVAQQLLIDFFAFYARYTNFITTAVLVQNPSTPAQAIYEMAVNSNTKVNTYGSGLSLDYLLPRGFIATGNVLFNKLNNVQAGLVTFFNTPEWKFNLSLANYTIAKRYGFNVTYRWQEACATENTFISGPLPAIGTLDAQISMKLPKIRSMIKLGGSNILNKYYVNELGGPSIGGLYYISFGYNVF